MIERFKGPKESVAAKTIGVFDDRWKVSECRTCKQDKRMRKQAKDCPECQKAKGKTWKG